MTILSVLILLIFGSMSNGKQCSSSELKLEGCPSEVKVSWWNAAPYVYNGTDKGLQTITGHMKEIVEMMVRECCGTCVSFRYLQSANNSRDLLKKIGYDSADLYFPVQGQSFTTTFQGHPFYSVIEPPGSIYFQVPVNPEDVPDALLNAVFSGWPVFVLTLVLAALSGIIIWAVDSFCNSDFPKSFFKGAWNGFWWAFVSMTTVGYGDRVPKGFVAKVFAFFWVLFGLVIIGIFTATISTALTSLCLRNDASIVGKSITALRYSEEEKYGNTNNAEIDAVTNIDDFVTKIINKEVTGGLLDSYMAGFHKQLLDTLEFSKVFEDNHYSYGFVLANNINNLVVPKCLRRKLSSLERKIDDIALRMDVIKQPPPNQALEKSLRLFDGNSKVFHMSVFVCLGVSALLLIGGVAWEYLYYRPKKGIKRFREDEKKNTYAVSYLDVHSAQCRDVEELILDIVEKFYKSFNDKMEDASSLGVKQKEQISS